MTRPTQPEGDGIAGKLAVLGFHDGAFSVLSTFVDSFADKMPQLEGSLTLGDQIHRLCAELVTTHPEIVNGAAHSESAVIQGFVLCAGHRVSRDYARLAQSITDGRAADRLWLERVETLASTHAALTAYAEFLEQD